MPPLVPRQIYASSAEGKFGSQRAFARSQRHAIRLHDILQVSKRRGGRTMSSQVSNPPAGAPSVSTMDKLQPCPRCRRLLPIRAPRKDETGAQWECDDCHAPLVGVFMKQAEVHLAE